VLHAIHDFLPRHRAGSEIYAFELCRELGRRHHVTVLAAEFDPVRPHGHVTWRVQDGLPVVEVVNNWIAGSVADTYRPPLITEQLAALLDVVQPDVIHVHSLLNLSFDLPALAHARGIPVAATLHDYTLVCPSGGQRVHRAEEHVCETIDPARCARCFPESPVYAHIGVGTFTGASGLGPSVTRAAAFLKRRSPRLARGLASAARRSVGITVLASDIVERLQRARELFDQIDLVVAPSRSIADEFARLGMSRSKVRVLDYGFVPFPRVSGRGRDGPLRIGFIGTLVWHKGVHVLVDAVRGLLPGDAYELKIFGSPDVFPDYAADLRKRSSGLPVSFLGEFDRSGAAEAYAQLDVLVVPSLWPENSPLVIHEAYMAGVPVVGARMGGIVELVDDGRNGLLYDPRSAPELTRVLQGLIDDRPRLDAFARMLPPVTSMEAHAREWEAMYAELIGRSSLVGHAGTDEKQGKRIADL
jgi:glycosyltransferase involved in cell wall biosynthesis